LCPCSDEGAAAAGLRSEQQRLRSSHHVVVAVSRVICRSAAVWVTDGFHAAAGAFLNRGTS
jgi:hypothetical protein